MPGYSKVHSWRFLDRLYHVRGVKRSFDVGALHPYAPNQYLVAYQVNRYRHVMRVHHDSHTPIWFTEFAWGSGHPDGGLNKGRRGQARALKASFRMFMQNRRRWHLERVIWFDWRDPPPPSSCTGNNFCNKAGLLRGDYTAKPAYRAYRRFVAHH
jgi:hypothetical protein